MADLIAGGLANSIEPCEAIGHACGKKIDAEIEMVMAEAEEATFIAELLAAANKPRLPNRAVVLVDLDLVVETLGGDKCIDLISDFGGELQKAERACAMVNGFTLVIKQGMLWPGITTVRHQRLACAQPFGLLCRNLGDIVS